MFPLSPDQIEQLAYLIYQLKGLPTAVDTFNSLTGLGYSQEEFEASSNAYLARTWR
jgi:hypothetical protein